jgi:AraC-like DNA-binding protein
MPQILTPYWGDTSQIFIELEEDLRIYISKNTRMVFSSLDANEMLILVEVNHLTHPTSIKYQYITDISTIGSGTIITKNTYIQIVINNRSNKYSFFKQELSGADLGKKIFESLSTMLGQLINEFLNCVLDYSNHKLPLFRAFYGLLVELYKDTQKSVKFPFKDQEKLHIIEQLLVGNFTDRPPNIELMATMIGMSVSKMKLLFKDFYGVSIYQYHQRAKLNYAANLLKTQRYTVSQVAYKVGYSHSIKFIKIFEKHFGTTPGKFKITDN